MREHRVTFYSPGTFFAEDTSKPIESWSPALAAEMAAGIVERHGARPYGFRFSTVLTAAPVSDGEGGELAVEPKQVEESGYHYLGGTVLSFDQIRVEGNKRDEILLSNMQNNGYPLVIRNCNSYQMTQPFQEADCIVDETGFVVTRGNEPGFVAYRDEMKAKWRAELEASAARWERATA